MSQTPWIWAPVSAAHYQISFLRKKLCPATKSVSAQNPLTARWRGTNSTAGSGVWWRGGCFLTSSSSGTEWLILEISFNPTPDEKCARLENYCQKILPEATNSGHCSGNFFWVLFPVDHPFCQPLDRIVLMDGQNLWNGQQFNVFRLG